MKKWIALLSALLLTFLYGYADADNLAASLLDDVDEGKACLSVGKEIVNDEHFVVGSEIWARHKHVVVALVGERVCLRHIFVVGAIGCLAFFGEHHRHVVEVAEEHGNGNAARLDGENLSHCSPRNLRLNS